MMRVSLAGLTRNAADQLDQVAAELRDSAGWHPDDVDEDGYGVDDPAEQADYYAHCLRELSQHARETAAGKHTVTEFADFYCLKKDGPDPDYVI